MDAISSDLNDARYGWAAHPEAVHFTQHGYSDSSRDMQHHTDSLHTSECPEEELATTPPSHFFLSLSLPNGSTEIYNDNRTAPDISHLPADNAIHQVNSVGDGPTWRAIKYHVDLVVGSGSAGETRVVPGVATLALPMGAARHALQRLIVVQVVVALVVLTLAGGLSCLNRHFLQPEAR